MSNEYWVAVVPASGRPFFVGPLSLERAEVVLHDRSGHGSRAAIIGRP